MFDVYSEETLQCPDVYNKENNNQIEVEIPSNEDYINPYASYTYGSYDIGPTKIDKLKDDNNV